MLKKLSIHNHMAKGFYNSLKGMLLPHPSLLSTSPTHFLLYNISNQTVLFISWSQPSWFSFSHHPSHCLHTVSWRSKPKWPFLPWKSQNAQCTGLHNVYVLFTNSMCDAISQSLGFRTVSYIYKIILYTNITHWWLHLAHLLSLTDKHILGGHKKNMFIISILIHFYRVWPKF